MKCYLSIDFEDFLLLSSNTKIELLQNAPESFQKLFNILNGDLQLESIDEDEDNELVPSEITHSMMEKSLGKLSEKTILVLKQIAKRNKTNFLISDIYLNLPNEYKKYNDMIADLRGVWGGLTKKAMSITGDDDAKFVVWPNENEYDDEGNFKDSEGLIHETTLKALRKYFKMQK